MRRKRGKAVVTEGAGLRHQNATLNLMLGIATKLTLGLKEGCAECPGVSVLSGVIAMFQ
jgi:hypothetical protein